MDIHQNKLILNRLFLGNEISLIGNVMKFLVEKCECCNEVNLVEDLEEVEIPNKPVYGCKEHHSTIGLAEELFCSTCKDEQCCKSCDEFCCDDDCDNRYVCSAENCTNVFCEDCADTLLGCSDCEERFCCKKVYKTIDCEGEASWHCENCVTVIHPQY